MQAGVLENKWSDSRSKLSTVWRPGGPIFGHRNALVALGYSAEHYLLSRQQQAKVVWIWAATRRFTLASCYQWARCASCCSGGVILQGNETPMCASVGSKIAKRRGKTMHAHSLAGLRQLSSWWWVGKQSLSNALKVAALLPCDKLLMMRQDGNSGIWQHDAPDLWIYDAVNQSGGEGKILHKFFKHEHIDMHANLQLMRNARQFLSHASPVSKIFFFVLMEIIISKFWTPPLNESSLNSFPFFSPSIYSIFHDHRQKSQLLLASSYLQLSYTVI